MKILYREYIVKNKCNVEHTMRKMLNAMCKMLNAMCKL